MDFADVIKVTCQLTLKLGDYSGLSWEVQLIIRILESRGWRGKWEIFEAWEELRLAWRWRSPCGKCEKEMDSANNQRLEDDWAPDENLPSANTFILALWDHEQRIKPCCARFLIDPKDFYFLSMKAVVQITARIWGGQWEKGKAQRQACMPSGRLGGSGDVGCCGLGRDDFLCSLWWKSSLGQQRGVCLCACVWFLTREMGMAWAARALLYPVSWVAAGCLALRAGSWRGGRSWSWGSL